MARIGFIALLVALGLGFLTYTEGSLAFQSSAQPEEISLKELISRGPGGNGHIVLTRFALCGNLVHQTDNKHTGWTNVWIPIIPIEEAPKGADEAPTPKNVKALFFSINIHNELELESRLNKPKVQALVTNRISSLSGDVRKLLQQSYPDTDFDTCLIVQEGRTPFSRQTVYLIGGGAFAALCLGIGLIVAARRANR